MSIVDPHTWLRRRDDPKRPAPAPEAFAVLDNAILSLDRLGDAPGSGFAAPLARSYRSVQAELRPPEPGSPLLPRRLTEARAELRVPGESLNQLASMISSREP